MKNKNRSSNSDDSHGETSDMPLKILRLSDRALTAEQRKEIESQNEQKSKGRREALYKWTNEEIIRYVKEFRDQRPAEYAEYLRQEKENSEIEIGLSLEMDRFARLVFPQMSLHDVIELKGEVRSHVRNSLGLKWEI